MICKHMQLGTYRRQDIHQTAHPLTPEVPSGNHTENFEEIDPWAIPMPYNKFPEGGVCPCLSYPDWIAIDALITRNPSACCYEC